MDLQRTKKAIEQWQADPTFHPLTCGFDSKHRPLMPVVKGDRLILVCPDCDYRQEHIPQLFTNEG